MLTFFVVLIALLFSLQFYLLNLVWNNLCTVRSIPSLRRLPTIIAPVPVSHPAWFIVEPWLGSLIDRLLPRRWLMWRRTGTLSWTYREGRNVADDLWANWRHKRLREIYGESEDGKQAVARLERSMNGTFVSVQPQGWHVSLCDDLAVMEVLKQKDVWLKPEVLYSILHFFQA